jgi:very-short-patch-repair endonuclease
VSELKHFLEFAERGPRAFAEIVTGSTGDFESPFEQYVASALQSRGWTIHTQVGVSEFRIDLGVVHPDTPGIYVAGVECDGATYHRSATARDRDKLREQVLRDLGWEIVRVWSHDWWIDRDTTLSRLDAQLRTLLEQSRKKRAAAPAPDPPPGPIAEPDEGDLPAEPHPELAVSTGGGPSGAIRRRIPCH